jgi:predicted neuraminidase
MNQMFCRAALAGLFFCLPLSSAFAQEEEEASSTGVTGISNSALLSQPGFLKSEFIYETAPFPQCHASTIVETRQGLVAAWFGGTRERNPDVCIYVSRLPGTVTPLRSPRDAVTYGISKARLDSHWTTPQQVADGIQSPTNRLPCWNPVLFQPKNGPLLLFYKIGPKPAEWWGMLITSKDGGRTWSKPVRLPQGILGPIKNKPVQLANGDILCPTSTEGEGGWHVHFERTRDLGRTWTATPPINDSKEISAIQPSILFHKDGSLQALGRTKQGKIFDAWSKDSGLTWSRMTLSELPNPNSGTDAVTLRDGRQLLVYNHNGQPKGRTPLNVAISQDGKTWQAALVVENLTGTQFSYPAVIQTSDGLVHITYTWKRLRVGHVVIDPAKLKLRPIVNGEWPK